MCSILNSSAFALSCLPLETTLLHFIMNEPLRGQEEEENNCLVNYSKSNLKAN